MGAFTDWMPACPRCLAGWIGRWATRKTSQSPNHQWPGDV